MTAFQVTRSCRHFVSRQHHSDRDESSKRVYENKSMKNLFPLLKHSIFSPADFLVYSLHRLFGCQKRKKKLDIFGKK